VVLNSTGQPITPLKHAPGIWTFLWLWVVPSALLYSYLALFKLIPEEPLFETSLFLITFVRTGKFLEERAKRKATESLRRMFGLQSLRVKVLKEGKEEEKGVYEVFIGDKIVLRTGDMVPLDCRLVEGKVVVDESMLTGGKLARS
jgi:Cu2+-exporting ATPase/Cu+-exporting ATPase